MNRRFSPDATTKQPNGAPGGCGSVVEEERGPEIATGSMVRSHHRLPCAKRRNAPDEWICDRCGSLWFGQLAGTDWLPLSCPDRGAHALAE